MLQQLERHFFGVSLIEAHFFIDICNKKCYNQLATQFEYLFPQREILFGKKYFLCFRIRCGIELRRGNRGLYFFGVSLIEAHFFIVTKKGEISMADDRKLYFYLFSKVADVIEAYDSQPAYESIVKDLIQLERETEELYMDMPDDEDEVTED